VGVISFNCKIIYEPALEIVIGYPQVGVDDYQDGRGLLKDVVGGVLPEGDDYDQLLGLGVGARILTGR
jgi:hypothetical protein